jgi:hypothetical protein
VLEKVGRCLVELAGNDQGLFHLRAGAILTLIKAFLVVVQNKIDRPQVIYGFLQSVGADFIGRGLTRNLNYFESPKVRCLVFAENIQVLIVVNAVKQFCFSQTG